MKKVELFQVVVIILGLFLVGSAKSHGEEMDQMDDSASNQTYAVMGGDIIRVSLNQEQAIEPQETSQQYTSGGATCTLQINSTITDHLDFKVNQVSRIGAPFVFSAVETRNLSIKDSQLLGNDALYSSIEVYVAKGQDIASAVTLAFSAAYNANVTVQVLNTNQSTNSTTQSTKKGNKSPKIDRGGVYQIPD